MASHFWGCLIQKESWLTEDVKFECRVGSNGFWEVYRHASFESLERNRLPKLIQKGGPYENGGMWSGYWTSLDLNMETKWDRFWCSHYIQGQERRLAVGSRVRISEKKPTLFSVTLQTLWGCTQFGALLSTYWVSGTLSVVDACLPSEMLWRREHLKAWSPDGDGEACLSFRVGLSKRSFNSEKSELLRIHLQERIQCKIWFQLPVVMSHVCVRLPHWPRRWKTAALSVIKICQLIFSLFTYLGLIPSYPSDLNFFFIIS